MSIEEAFKEFSESLGYKELCKGTDNQAVKYRVYLGRFRKDKLKFGGMAEILQANGYDIKANKATKRK